MKKLELNKMGLAPMSEFEMQEVDGGSFWKWIAAAVLVLVGLIVDNLLNSDGHI